MYWTAVPWWQRYQARQSQIAWCYWIDPWGELRVAQSGRYYYERPAPPHREALIRAGWKEDGDHVYTDDVAVANESLMSLGLESPEYKGNHSYRVYWHEPTYYI